MNLVNDETKLSDLQQLPLSEMVVHTLENYFKHLEGEMPCDLYPMVLKEVEKGFFKVIMKKAKGNQTLAASMCGLARGTLIKKLKIHSLE